MQIIPGQGTDLIAFGVTEQQAIDLLGEPDKSYLADTYNKRLQYYDLRIELSFEAENGNRLGWIEVHDDEAVLGERTLIGERKEEVIDFVTNMLGEQPILDDYHSFESVTYDDQWVELQFEFGRLNAICFGVSYDDNGDPVWPIT